MDSINKSRVKELENGLPETFSKRQLLAFALDYHGIHLQNFSREALGKSSTFLNACISSPIDSSRGGFDKDVAQTVKTLFLDKPYNQQDFWQRSVSNQREKNQFTLQNISSIPRLNMQSANLLLSGKKATELPEHQDLDTSRISHFSQKDLKQSAPRFVENAEIRDCLEGLLENKSVTVTPCELLRLIVFKNNLRETLFVTSYLEEPMNYFLFSQTVFDKQVTKKVAHLFNDSPYNETAFWDGKSKSGQTLELKSLKDVPSINTTKLSHIGSLFKSSEEIDYNMGWPSNKAKHIQLVKNIANQPELTIQKGSDYQGTATATYPGINTDYLKGR